MNLLSDQAEVFIAGLAFREPNEEINSLEIAGNGNMNAVYRVHTSKRSVILKQSFPFVKKYPQLAAPIERIHTEYTFLKLAQSLPSLRNQSPEVLNYFPELHLLVLEDFGSGSDFSFLYQKNQRISPDKCYALLNYLNALHSIDAVDFPKNEKMRELNHEHIFSFPFSAENGLDLNKIQNGLQEAAIPFHRDDKLKSEITALGKRYLSGGDTLLHGDFYPGSWLDTASGPKVIDPEFAFVGDREFDLGVWKAHMLFARMPAADFDQLLTSYAHDFDMSLVNRYAGVELLRRMIGIAQLDLTLSLEEKKELMEMAKSMILSS